MKKKVTLRELLFESVVLGFLLVAYYWTWARTDWKSYYDTIQNGVSVFVFVYFLLIYARVKQYNKEKKDELAIINLKRCDSIAMKFFVVVNIVSAWLSVLSVVDNRVLGYLLVGSVAISMLIRYIAFSIMDSKGV